MLWQTFKTEYKSWPENCHTGITDFRQTAAARACKQKIELFDASVRANKQLWQSSPNDYKIVSLYSKLLQTVALQGNITWPILEKQNNPS